MLNEFPNDAELLILNCIIYNAKLYAYNQLIVMMRIYSAVHQFECIGNDAQIKKKILIRFNQRIELHRVRNANASFNMHRIFLNDEIDKVIINAKHLIDFSG